MANDYRDRDRGPYRGESRGDFGSGYPIGDFNEPGYGRYGGYRGDNFFGGGAEREEASRHRPLSFRGRGPKGYQRSDERIHEEVCERLTDDHDVDASEIEVTVSGAAVSLSGSVTDRFAKRRAEDIAESVPGVKDVQNGIRVARG